MGRKHIIIICGFVFVFFYHALSMYFINRCICGDGKLLLKKSIMSLRHPYDDLYITGHLYGESTGERRVLPCMSYFTKSQ